MLGRRQIVMGAAATVGSAMIRPLAAAPFEWLKVSPSDAGFASDLEARLDKLIADNRAWGLHGVLVVRGRHIVLERYFEAEDNNWGQMLGVVQFGPDTLQNLYSATKSVVALVYGIALAEGKVPPPGAPLYAQFPNTKILSRRTSAASNRPSRMRCRCRLVRDGTKSGSPTTALPTMRWAWRWLGIATASCLSAR
jgi:hypothetical protein